MKKIFQIFILLMGLILMVGFGLCGIAGIKIGVVDHDGFVFTVLGLVGMMISVQCGMAIYKVLRAFRRPAPDEAPAAPADE